MEIRDLYYWLKPFLPRTIQLFLRSKLVTRQRTMFRSTWPINMQAGKKQECWTGWPDKKRFALILTHVVDTETGQKKCQDLMELEETLGFRSSFNFVPERYYVDPDLRQTLTGKRFEVGVHGLNHDGKLYKSWQIFQERAVKINGYLKKWNAVGFRSPAMHHNLEWLHELDVEYDASTFDTDPFEPQPDGVGTIFPFWVKGNGNQKGYVELPYTLPQDFTLFVLMREKNINIWKKKLDWIVEQGGMALVNTHPDYMNFSQGKMGLEEYPSYYYQELLEYIKRKYKGQYWHVLPKEMAHFWKNKVVKKN